MPPYQSLRMPLLVLIAVGRQDTSVIEQHKGTWHAHLLACARQLIKKIKCLVDEMRVMIASQREPPITISIDSTCIYMLNHHVSMHENVSQSGCIIVGSGRQAYAKLAFTILVLHKTILDLRLEFIYLSQNHKSRSHQYHLEGYTSHLLHYSSIYTIEIP